MINTNKKKKTSSSSPFVNWSSGVKTSMPNSTKANQVVSTSGTAINVASAIGSQKKKSKKSYWQ